MKKLLALVILLLPSLVLAQAWGDHEVRCTAFGSSANNAAICHDTTNDLLWHDTDHDNTWDVGEQILTNRLHATDCTGLSDGQNGDICLELDANAIYVCETADQCDADEWVAYATAGGHGDGANCAAGNYPLGVDASGAVQSCTDATTEIDAVVATHTAISGAHHTATTDTGPSPDCAGTTTYQDGEGGCDDISAVYAAIDHDATHIDGGSDEFNTDDMATACTVGQGLLATAILDWACTDLASEAELTTHTADVDAHHPLLFERTLESPADADSFVWFKVPTGGLTITDIHCIIDPADTGESVVIDVRECTSTADTCVTVDATITCDNDGAEDDGVLSNSAVDAGDWLLLDIGTVTGTVTQVAVTMYAT
jgi:hypothetical protein